MNRLDHRRSDATNRASAAVPEAAEIPLFLALAIAGVWTFMLSLLFAAAPPVDPDAPIDVVNELLGLAFWLTLLVGAGGLLIRQRWALMASTAAAGLLGIGAVLCFADGHTGAWLAIQAGTAVGIGGVSGILATRL